MKRILFLFTLSGSLTAQAEVTYEKFIDAMILRESSFRRHVKGDDGRARGYFQIHRSYLEDANWWSGTRYTHWDMHTPSKALATVESYFERWCSHYILKYNKPVTYKILAMIHNQGPKGYNRIDGEYYWKALQNSYRQLHGETLSANVICDRYNRIFTRKKYRR